MAGQADTITRVNAVANFDYLNVMQNTTVHLGHVQFHRISPGKQATIKPHLWPSFHDT